MIRIGGLRGGSLVLAGEGVFLRRYSVVPGVTLSVDVSGDEPDNAPVVLRIGGPAAARGWLRTDEHGVSGWLGGHRLRFRARRFGSDAAIATSARAEVARLPGHPQLPPLPPALRRLLGWR